MDEVVLRVSDFRKRYGNKPAVDGISFSVHRGEIFGLLGPNGAGKTTTLECLEGLRWPDEGRLDILGVNPGRQPGKLRDLIGVQLQTSALPASMTPTEAMRFFCAYHRKPMRLDLVDRLGLAGETERTVRVLVRGPAAPPEPGAGRCPPAAGGLPRRAYRGP